MLNAKRGREDDDNDAENLPPAKLSRSEEDLDVTDARKRGLCSWEKIKSQLGIAPTSTAAASGTSSQSSEKSSPIESPFEVVEDELAGLFSRVSIADRSESGRPSAALGI